MHAYQQKRTVDEVYSRVQRLFGNHKDLMEEFTYFLPENQAATQTPTAKKPGPKPKPKARKAQGEVGYCEACALRRMTAESRVVIPRLAVRLWSNAVLMLIAMRYECFQPARPPPSKRRMTEKGEDGGRIADDQREEEEKNEEEDEKTSKTKSTGGRIASE